MSLPSELSTKPFGCGLRGAVGPSSTPILLDYPRMALEFISLPLSLTTWLACHAMHSAHPAREPSSGR